MSHPLPDASRYVLRAPLLALMADLEEYADTDRVPVERRKAYRHALQMLGDALHDGTGAPQPGFTQKVIEMPDSAWRLIDRTTALLDMDFRTALTWSVVAAYRQAEEWHTETRRIADALDLPAGLVRFLASRRPGPEARAAAATVAGEGPTGDGDADLQAAAESAGVAWACPEHPGERFDSVRHFHEHLRDEHGVPLPETDDE